MPASCSQQCRIIQSYSPCGDNSTKTDDPPTFGCMTPLISTCIIYPALTAAVSSVEQQDASDSWWSTKIHCPPRVGARLWDEAAVVTLHCEVVVIPAVDRLGWRECTIHRVSRHTDGKSRPEQCHTVRQYSWNCIVNTTQILQLRSWAGMFHLFCLVSLLLSNLNLSISQALVYYNTRNVWQSQAYSPLRVAPLTRPPAGSSKTSPCSHMTNVDILSKLLIDASWILAVLAKSPPNVSDVH